LTPPDTSRGVRHTPALLGLTLTWAGAAHAAQPIFDEMPRWSNGWGVQVVEEYRRDPDLLLGPETVGEDQVEQVHILHVQGVYTWKKWIRMTLKIPYVVHAQRARTDPSGTPTRDTTRGFGDTTVAVPLKHYFNLDGRSGSWTLAPQVRVPLAKPSAYSVYPHRWGGGLSGGYETETYLGIIAGSLTGWLMESPQPAELAAVLSIGLNIRAMGRAGHLKWKTRLLSRADQTLTLSAGPTLYWSFTDTLHTQVQWTHDFYDRPGLLMHGNGDTVTAGIGVAF